MFQHGVRFYVPVCVSVHDSVIDDDDDDDDVRQDDFKKDGGPYHFISLLLFSVYIALV